MNIDKLKAMLELTAMQNMGTSSTNNSTSDVSSIFQNLLDELLTDSGLSTDNSLSPDNSLPLADGLTPPIDALDNTDGNPTMTFPSTGLSPISLLKTGSTGNINQIINKAAKAFNLPTKLIASVIKQESNFNPSAVSGSGASGLMQLMPSTAQSLGVEDVFDPEQNVLAGSKYLKQLMDKYGNNVELALAAYNAGPGNVDKYGGIPPFKETQNYVRNITNLFYS